MSLLYFIFSHADVPCSSLSITVNVDNVKLPLSLESLKGCIDVSVVGGLHITECIEMPGGILIRWDEVINALISYSYIRLILVVLRQSNNVDVQMIMLLERIV